MDNYPEDDIIANHNRYMETLAAQVTTACDRLAYILADTFKPVIEALTPFLMQLAEMKIAPEWKHRRVTARHWIDYRKTRQ